VDNYVTCAEPMEKLVGHTVAVNRKFDYECVAESVAPWTESPPRPYCQLQGKPQEIMAIFVIHPIYFHFTFLGQKYSKDRTVSVQYEGVIHPLPHAPSWRSA
jgi:hypothetical protein